MVVHFSFRWFVAKMLLTVKSWKFWTKKTFTSSLRVGFVNHDIQRKALCFSYTCFRSFSLWKTTWISRRWFCTFSDTYGSILHIFSSRNTSLSAQVTTDESKALSFGLIIHIRKRLLWTTYTRFTPLSSRSLSSLTCRPFGRSLTKVLTCR